MFSKEDGRYAVKKARETIIRALQNKKPITSDAGDVFRKNCGVFVTINTYPAHSLRGCIGYPEPVKPLITALVDSAVSAATRDPRFNPVEPEELETLVIEVSLLTPPKEIEEKKVTQLLDRIEIGSDGLIVEKGPYRGLLLPQVATDQKWEAEEFLQHTCMKAGLPADSWLDRKTKIFSFQAEIFMEETPGGKIVPKKLK